MTSGQGSLFGDVVDWFLTRVGDRRQYKRRPGAFHLWWQPAPDRSVPGIGTELSANGLMFMLEQPLPAAENNLVLGVRETKIPVRVRVVRTDQVDYKGKKWHRYMGEFTGIAADHWDIIVRYVNDTPEPTDRRKMQNQEMDGKVDDAYRLLPMQIQEKIIAVLVEQKRLQAPKPGQSPLLKLFYGGVAKKPDGGVTHRFNVHSRIKVQDEFMAYDTRFLVDEAGNVQVQK